MSVDQRLSELNLKIAGQINSLASASAKKELAVVSPCSNCQNFTQSSTNNTDPNRVSCPRRVWIDQKTNADPSGQGPDPVLYLSGTTDPNKLANPVVDQSTNNYLIWIAAVEDNPGVLDDQGNQVTPGILDPKFNNLYIRCRPFPFVSEHHHDVLRGLGPFQEMDYVVAEQHRVPPMTTPFTNNQIQYAETPVAGTVSKTSFAYYFNTQNPDDHALTPG